MSNLFGRYATNSLVAINPPCVLNPLNVSDIVDMSENRSNSYLKDCLLQKFFKKDDWSIINSYLIAVENILLPTVFPNLKGFAGYGITEDGNVFVEYYGGTVDDFNKVVSPTMDNDIGKFEKTAILINSKEVKAIRVDKYGSKHPYKIQMTSKRGTDEHSPRALVAAILAYLWLSPDAKTSVYAKSINKHFSDAVSYLKKNDISGSALPILALVNDMYALTTNDSLDIEAQYGELPFDTDIFLKPFETFEPNSLKLTNYYGSSTLLNEKTKVETKVKAKAKAVSRIVKDLVKEFSFAVDWSNAEKSLIPNDCENVNVSNEAYRTLNVIKTAWESPMKIWNICWYGPSGTGKSTDARALAQAIGFPYYPMALSDATYADDLLITKTANTSQMSKTDFLDMIARYPSVVEASKDVETAWEKLTGHKMPGVTIEQYEEKLNDKIYALCENTKPFKEVTSPLFDAYVNGGLCELVEANAMKPAQAKVLNSMLDDTAQIVIEGKVYKRNPNFICISTFNCDPGTEGVHTMSRDFMQRYQYGEFFDEIRDNEIKSRIMRKTSLKDESIIEKCIKVFRSMQKVCAEQGDTHDFVGLRQLYNWCNLIAITDKPYETGLGTMVNIGTLDEDFAEKLKESLKTQFDEYSD